MSTSRLQRTLSRSAVVEGFGYWSDQDVRVEFRPAAEDTGIVFVRADHDPAVHIPAAIELRIEAPRRTTLRAGNASVEMVEHILAALAGLRIDNCEVWVNATEMPGMDGSSLPFVEALDAAGVVVQAASRPALVVRDTVRCGDDAQWIEAAAPTGDDLTIEYHLDYGEGSIGRQSHTVQITPEAFRRELANSRTFVRKEEAEWLQSQGLATRATCHDLLVFDEYGPIDNPLRFEDECVRHKLLDVVGDLALAGCDVLAHIKAHRTGHRLNAELVRRLVAAGELMSAPGSPALKQSA